MAVLSARIRHLSNLCPICKNHSETVMHALFQCDFAQRAWLVSSLPLRTQGLNLSFKETMSKMSADLSEAGMVSFICNIWAIWRMQNEAVHGGKSQSVGACQAIYKKEMEAFQVNLIASGMLPGSLSTQRSPSDQIQGTIAPQQVPNAMCFVDRAWDADGKAGIGVCLWLNGEVVHWMSKAIQAVNPSQAEAKAVLEGYRMMKNKAGGEGVIYSDSLETVLALQNRLPTISDWRSSE